jgi:hypothetical protein
VDEDGSMFAQRLRERCRLLVPPVASVGIDYGLEDEA